jgi:hypothetical protein
MRIMKLLRPPRTASAALAVVLAAALSAVFGSTPAHAVTAQADRIIFHHCRYFGTAHKGYSPAQCSDMIEHANNTVDFQGQTFCQTVLNAADDRCTAITMQVTVTSPGQSVSYTWGCPSIDPTIGVLISCPPDSFIRGFDNQQFECNIVYGVYVQSKVTLPGPANIYTETSDSYGFTSAIC